MLFIVAPVPFPVIFHVRVFEEGHLDRILMGELGHSEAYLPKWSPSIPYLVEHTACFVEDDSRHVRRPGSLALLLDHGEILVLDEHGYRRCPEIVFPDPVGNYAGHVEKRPVDILRISKVLAESPLGTVALRFGDFGIDGRIIPSVGIFMQLGGE